MRAMTMEKRFWRPMPGDILLTRSRAFGGRVNAACQRIMRWRHFFTALLSARRGLFSGGHLGAIREHLVAIMLPTPQMVPAYSSITLNKHGALQVCSNRRSPA